MSKLVSILIPAYNAEKWIEYTIRSALSQTWHKKEIIVVDDGSQDNTLQIAKRFESKIVKVVTQENMGASRARNEAMSLSQGDYVQWLDADDLLAPNKISEQMNVAISDQITDLTLLSSAYGLFYWRTEKARFISSELWQDLTPVDWIIKKFSQNRWMNPAVYLVSRRLSEKAGPWNEKLSLDDDGEYFSRVVVVSERVKFVRVKGCYYRVSSFKQLNKDVTEKGYRSLLLSMTLSIRSLLSMEDSVRTRKACVAFLQSVMPFFYPEKTELLENVKTLAVELGGELTPPRFDMKHRIIQKLFGWNITKRILRIKRKINLFVNVKFDEMMYGISTDPDK